MPLTSDPSDPRLTHGVDRDVDQADVYLVLSEKERASGYVRPVRQSYLHNACGSVTTMKLEIAQTYAKDPFFYGATYCCMCRGHFPVGEHGEFIWTDGSGSKVGS